MRFEEARALFPVLGRIAYLNAGTFGPLPQPVVEALEAGLAQNLREHLELVREVRRVDQHRLLAGAQRHRVRLPERARQDERVLVDSDDFQATPRSLAASRRFLTSSVGFFWFDSSLRP